MQTRTDSRSGKYRIEHVLTNGLYMLWHKAGQFYVDRTYDESTARAWLVR